MKKSNIREKSETMRQYLVFWGSQSFSQLGSAMTGFALIIWAYQKTSSAMAVSLMTFCNYLPYVLVSLFVGSFIDAHNKKRILVCSDTAAALCSLAVLLLLFSNRMEIYHIYIVNFILGFMNSIQIPAKGVAVGILAGQKNIGRVSGMDSFSNALISVTAPPLAAIVLTAVGMKGVIFIDLATFIAAVFVLGVFVRIPEEIHPENEKKSVLSGCKEGFTFLFQRRGLLMTVLSLSLMNFFSRLTYENILSPMILARSGGSELVLSIVSALLGVGGIIGGIIVTLKSGRKYVVEWIFLTAAASFFFGDILMGLGRGVLVWSVAALAASTAIPFIMAGQNVLLYAMIPQKMQGRVFAARNAIQFGTIPIGILLGGFLADSVFEPFMAADSKIAATLSRLVGQGTGSGMAVMFLMTGILGSFFSLLCYRMKSIRKLKEEINRNW